jgi:hypothetical protein
MVTMHNHPWSAAALILRGGYTELRAEGKFTRRALTAYTLSFKDKHAVVETKAGTWSLFMHWFKRTEWAFSLEPCKVVCDRCAKDYGVCEKSMRTASLSDMVDVSTKSRKQTWQQVTPAFHKKQERRRAAIKKLGIVPTVVDPIRNANEVTP